MSDTDDNQWPRFQVFHQSRQDRPHTNVGTVHAPDAEIALQNARDVFVRRPECSSLWVVPASLINSMTAEQFQRDGPPALQTQSSRPETYLVFEKRSHIGSHEHQGELQARSGQEALGLAAGSSEPGVLVWWVVPKQRLVASEPEQSDSLFGSATGKDYRGQAAFPTTTMMRKIRQEIENDS